jgi:hypothetical protein
LEDRKDSLRRVDQACDVGVYRHRNVFFDSVRRSCNAFRQATETPLVSSMMIKELTVIFSRIVDEDINRPPLLGQAGHERHNLICFANTKLHGQNPDGIADITSDL